MNFDKIKQNILNSSETVTNLVNTNLETFKSTLWQGVTKK